MAKVTLNDITAGYGSNDLHNANNAAIEAGFENTLSRDGTTPNQMNADIDMNSNDLLNVGTVGATRVTLDGVPISASVVSVDDTNVTHTTGGPAGTVSAKLDEHISVKDFGAVGDGVTDDTSAFNLFFAYIKTFAQFGQITAPNTVEDGAINAVIPSGRYLCDGSINATAIRGLGVTIVADGATIHSKATGKAALDLLGSRWLTIKGLKITGDATNTPRTGFQYGRITTATYSCDNFHFDRCKTDGYFTLAAVYNLASETDTHTHPEYYNSQTGGYCFINDGNNFHEATSDFQTANLLSGLQSMSNVQHTFLGADMRQLVSGNTYWMSDAAQVKFYNSYLVSKDGSCVVFSDEGNGFKDIHLDIHFESTGLQHCVRFEEQAGAAVTWSHIRRFTLIDHAPFAADSIFDIDVNLDRVIMHDADISIPRVGIAPTNKLTAQNTKLYILGKLHGISTVINDVRLYGHLSSDNVAGIASLPSGNYSSTTQGGSLDWHGSQLPYTDNTDNIGSASKRYNQVYGAQLYIGDGTRVIRTHTASPEGVITGPVGSLCVNTNGGTGTTLYVKESGTGNTGWVAK